MPPPATLNVARRTQLARVGKKSLLSVATLSALALLSNSASAALSLQYDGFGAKVELGPGYYDHTFVGANVVNNGYTGSNFTDRFGDHSDPSGSGKYNTTGDVNLTYTQSVFDKILANDTLTKPGYFDIFGAGLVFGSSGSSTDDNQAKLDGNVSIHLKDIRLTEADGSGKPGFSVFGAGGMQGAVGDASMRGDVSIVLENVYSYDSDVSGGGETNGADDPAAPTMNTSIDVTGDIAITLKNSTISYVTGGSSITGDVRPGHEASSATGNINGDITINLVDSHLVGVVYNTDEDDYFPYSALIGGGEVSDNGIADVTGTVNVNFANSDADFIIGGGLTTEVALNTTGKSATVGAVRMTFDNSTVRKTLIAGGVTDFTVFEDTSESPVGGDARVKGDVNVVLKNGTTVKTVYMSGYGDGADVEGNSTLVIADSSVKVAEDGVLYGQGKVVENGYEGSTKKTSTLAFGLDDTAYVGDFSAAFQDFDLVTATKGSTVDLGTLDATKHGRIGTNGRSSLSFAGEGTFLADINLAGAHDVNVSARFGADTVTLTQGAVLTVTGEKGELTAGKLALNGGTLLVTDNAALRTTTGEVFTIALNADGTNVAEANALKYSAESLLFTEGGTLALTDAKFNKDYADTATGVFKNSYKDGSIAFTGQLVDASGDVEESVDIGDVNDGQIFEKTDVTAKADETGKVEVDKSFGGRTLQLGKGVASVDVTNGNTLTLVGSSEGGELVAYEGDKAPALNVAGGLALGSETADVKGSISAAIDLSGKDGLTVKNGSFTLADVTVSGETKLDAGQSGKLGVTKLTLANDVAVSGAVSVETLAADKAAALDVTGGNLAVAKGSLKNVAVTVGTSAAAAYAAANETPAASSTDATTFAFGGNTVDGSIVANANGVVAIGTTDLSAFHSVFSEEFGTWSNNTAAAFVAGPVTVEKTGSLHVGSSNAQVAFGANSVLVADITGMTAEDTLITADKFAVDAGSVAYLVGSVKDGVATYKLTSDTNPDVKYWNSEETLKSGSAMLEVAFDDAGNWTVANVNAAEAYGNLMQGHALADAGYRSQGAERDYAQALLSDTTGLSNAAVAARFDAAMNPGGSLAVFTTAYDRASDLRRVVRDEAAAASTESRLWARVTGGMTKLDGISTGAQALDVETDAYGLAVGAESMLGDWKLGGAFTAGTGDTDNDDVAAKDEFDFYGLSFYGKKSIGAYDVLFDATAAWVKSDLKVNGVADLTTDTTTSVYGLGAEVRRTADLGAVKLTPFVGANLYYVTSDGYTTNHGVRVDDADATAVEFPIGAELSAAFDTAGGMRLAPAFSLAVVPTAGDTEVDQTVAFAGATSSYRFTFADDVKVRSNLALTAEAGDFAFGLKAGFEWGDEERGATTFSLNAAYRF